MLAPPPHYLKSLSTRIQTRQLIIFPGYMLNYAACATLVADLRARVQELYGPYTEGDRSWYGHVSEHLYQFGLAITSKDIVAGFPGRPVSP
jgi:hypothetical protein